MQRIRRVNPIHVKILINRILTLGTLVILTRQAPRITILERIRIRITSCLEILIHARRFPILGMVQDLIEQLVDGEAEECSLRVLCPETLEHRAQPPVEFYGAVLTHIDTRLGCVWGTVDGGDVEDEEIPGADCV